MGPDLNQDMPITPTVKAKEAPKEKEEKKPEEKESGASDKK